MKGKMKLKQNSFLLLVTILLFFIMYGIGCVLFNAQGFSKTQNFLNLFISNAGLIVIGIGMTVVMITGGIDISGGAITGLSCMVLALLQRDTGMNFYLTLLIAVMFAIAAGFANGIIVYDFKVPPMIATLGMSTIIRGIIKIISKALTVSGLDERILNMGNNSFFGLLPALAIIWAVVALVVFLILRYTVFGRNLYVIGSGVEVAKLSGIKVRKMFYSVYAFAGLLYGIAGIMLAARVQSALPTGGEGYDMNAIAAAVIGGASLSGGRGAVSGTLLGTILMVLINNAGVQFGLNTHVLEITSGVLIVFAVTMDMVKNRKKA